MENNSHISITLSIRLCGGSQLARTFFLGIKNFFSPTRRCYPRSNSPGLPVFTLRLGKHQVRVARTVVCSVRPCITSCGLNMITVLFTWARPLRATPCVPASAGLAPGPSRRVHSPNIWRDPPTQLAPPRQPLATFRRRARSVIRRLGIHRQRRAHELVPVAPDLRARQAPGGSGRRPPCLGAREDDRKILAQSGVALATCRHLRIRPNTEGASRLWMGMGRVDPLGS